jgi:hypothetical protein
LSRRTEAAPDRHSPDCSAVRATPATVIDRRTARFLSQVAIERLAEQLPCDQKRQELRVCRPEAMENAKLSPIDIEGIARVAFALQAFAETVVRSESRR